MKKINLLLILLQISSTLFVSHAQETGTVNRGSYSFTIPEGWAGQYLDGSYLMGSYTEPGMILMVENTHTRIEDLKREIRSGLTDNYSYEFQIIGEMQTESNNMLSCDFEGVLEGEQVRGFLTGVVNEKLGGLLIIAITTPDQYSVRYAELSKEVAASLSLISSPKNTGTTANHRPDSDFAQQFNGVKLTYMNSYYSSSYTDGGVSGGYSDEEIISLCTSGHFTFSSSSETTAGGNYSSMYGQSGERGDGTWNINTTGSSQGILTLRFNNGSKKEYQIEINQKGETYLNGYRYYRTTGASGPDYAPICY